MICSNVSAQELLKNLPTLENVGVTSHVEKKDSAFFAFSYDLYNHEVNEGEIFQFEIDISYKGLSKPDTSFLYTEDSFENTVFRQVYPSVEGLIVPVGFMAAPGRWNGVITRSLTANFGGYPLINSGDSLGGFIFLSKGLPGIRHITIKPRFNVDEYFPSIESDTAFSFEEMDSLKQSTFFHSNALGPWLPDSTLSLQDFTDTLETFRYRSCEELGWATDEGVCGQLESYLEDVRSYLNNEDSLRAADALQDFIDLAESEKDNSLTSEGYALLYYNGRYLLEKLIKPD